MNIASQDALHSILYAMGETPQEEVSQGLFSVTVPHTKDYVPALLEAAKLKSVRLENLNFLPEGIKVRFKTTSQAQFERVFSYVTPSLRQLGSGGWTTFGRIQVRLNSTSVLPHLQHKGEALRLVFSGQISVRPNIRWKLFRRLATTNLVSITITPDRGTVEVSGPLEFVLPELIWS